MFYHAAFAFGEYLFLTILLMEDIPHHLGCIRLCKWWDKLPINWLCFFFFPEVYFFKGAVFKYTYTRWWFRIFFIFTLTRGNDPIWLIFFRWVETTNQYIIHVWELVFFPWLLGGHEVTTVQGLKTTTTCWSTRPGKMYRGTISNWNDTGMSMELSK